MDYSKPTRKKDSKIGHALFGEKIREVQSFSENEGPELESPNFTEILDNPEEHTGRQRDNEHDIETKDYLDQTRLGEGGYSIEEPSRNDEFHDSRNSDGYHVKPCDHLECQEARNAKAELAKRTQINNQVDAAADRYWQRRGQTVNRVAFSVPRSSGSYMERYVLGRTAGMSEEGARDRAAKERKVYTEDLTAPKEIQRSGVCRNCNTLRSASGSCNC